MFKRLYFKLRDAFLHFKWRCQRFCKGYADVDVWNVDGWFLNYAPKLLKELKETKHGTPYQFTEEEWDAILDKMINCFIEADEDTCSEKNEFDAPMLTLRELKDKNDYDAEVVEKLDKWHSEWCAREKDIGDYREQKLREGLDLFKEYFWDLWD